MGKHVVYLRVHDEASLRAAGHDPSDWVRDVVKKALEGRSEVFPEPPPRRDPDPQRQIKPDWGGKKVGR